MDLIATFKAQHQELNRAVAHIQRALERADRAMLSTEVSQLGRKLSSHLQLEDRALYPVLLRGPHSRTARHFAIDVARLKAEAALFFELHRPGEIDLEAFEPDFVSLSSVLGSRIFSEEQALYPLYVPAKPHEQLRAARRGPSHFNAQSARRHVHPQRRDTPGELEAPQLRFDWTDEHTNS